MKKVFIFLIKIYRKYFSPLKRTKCPYYPTCSTYALEAIEKYGIIDEHRKSYGPVSDYLQKHGKI